MALGALSLNSRCGYLHQTVLETACRRYYTTDYATVPDEEACPPGMFRNGSYPFDTGDKIRRLGMLGDFDLFRRMGYGGRLAEFSALISTAVPIVIVFLTKTILKSGGELRNRRRHPDRAGGRVLTGKGSRTARQGNKNQSNKQEN